MSQEKVDRYKAEKANRKQTMKKEKYKSIATRICVAVFGVALIGWCSYSIYDRYESSKPTEYLEIDSSAISDYEASISTEE